LVASGLDDGELWQTLLALGSDDLDADFDDDRASELVHLLNQSGGQDVVSWALAALESPSPWHRQAAAWVLAEHGYNDGRPFGAQVVPAVTAAAYREVDGPARCALVRAIGFSEDPATEDDLLHFATDLDPAIREIVAQCLPSVLAGNPSEKALDALIVLSLDANPHVRDWATFAIAQQTELDTPAIRQVLRARLEDYEDDEDGPTATSGEALLGLAVRHDETAYAQLLRLLDAPIQDIGNLTIEAAGALGDARLVPKLIRLREAGWHKQVDEPLPDTLERAIDALKS
jgi:hypothetical protein